VVAWDVQPAKTNKRYKASTDEAYIKPDLGRPQTCHSWCVSIDLCFSSKLMCGVRQGGVLSPVLFAVYVNDIIVALSESGAGCYYDNMSVGCVMYADDLLLLSASLCDLQHLL